MTFPDKDAEIAYLRATLKDVWSLYFDSYLSGDSPSLLIRESAFKKLDKKLRAMGILPSPPPRKNQPK